jgi:hypothetical protein
MQANRRLECERELAFICPQRAAAAAMPVSGLESVFRNPVMYRFARHTARGHPLLLLRA